MLHFLLHRSAIALPALMRPANVILAAGALLIVGLRLRPRGAGALIRAGTTLPALRCRTTGALPVDAADSPLAALGLNIGRRAATVLRLVGALFFKFRHLKH